METAKYKLLSSGIILLMTGLTSCVSTDVIEPGNANTEIGEELTIRFQSPDNLSTRNDGSHKLRYVAKVIYMPTNVEQDWSQMQRQEMIEDPSKSENVMTFKVDPDKKYQICIFADYIPAESAVNGSGLYPDYYYNTQAKNNDQITMITNPSGSGTFNSSFFNNDYYDCFSYQDTIHKSLLKRELTCKLERATAKIRFIDDNASSENLSNVKFSRLNYLSQFSQINQEPLYNVNVTSSQLSGIILDEMTDESQKEVFFFYTFAGGKSSEYKYLKDLIFTTTNKEGGENTINIPEGTIPIQKNFITTVKGSFIKPLSGGNNPSPEPSDPENPDTPEYGDLYLNMSVNGGWQTGQTVNP